MNGMMITSATTLRELQQKIDTHAHNLANVNTTGFRRRETTFGELLSRELNNQPHVQYEQGRLTPHGLRLGQGARINQTTLDMRPGQVQQTDQPLDFMIEGRQAWFRLAAIGEDGDEEIVYTRDGRFQLTPDPEQAGWVRVVAADGSPLLAADGNPITFPAAYDTIELREDGLLTVYNKVAPEENMIFIVGLAYIERPDQLAAIGENRFRWLGEEEVPLINLAEQAPGPDLVRLHQGRLETSNVDLVQEMTQVMATQRLLQLQARSVSIADEMMGLANGIRA